MRQLAVYMRKAEVHGMENMATKIDNLERQITDERARLSSDRMDISFGEIINMYRNDELIIRPEYQRLFR